MADRSEKMEVVKMNLNAEIASLAYELYEKSGGIEGRDLDNWLEAERIVMSRYTLQETSKTEVVRSPKKKAIRISTKKSETKKRRAKR
jgi:hypothetical protein